MEKKGATVGIYGVAAWRCVMSRGVSSCGVSVEIKASGLLGGTAASPLNTGYPHSNLVGARQGLHRKSSTPCHVGPHWIALDEYSQMSTHMPGFQSFFSFFLHHFVLAELATTSITS